MAETTHQTRLDIKINARDVNKLETDIKRTFDGKAIQQLTRAMLLLGRAIKDQTRDLKEFAATLREVGKGAQSVEKVSQSVQRLGQTSRAAAGTGGAGGVGGGQQGWWSRFAGLPSGRTDTARMARGMGDRAASFAGAPDAGGLANAMTAIPVLGAFGATAMLSSFMNYSSYMQYEHARMGALPFLGAKMPGMTLGQAAGAGRRSAMQAAMARIGTGGLGENTGEERAGAPPSITYITPDNPYGVTIEETPVERFERESRERAATASGRPMRGRGIGETEIITHPVDFRNRAQREDAAKQEQDAAIRAARAAYEVSVGGFTAAGLRFGLGPADALQQAAAASQAAYGNVGPRGFEALLAARQTTGVDLGLGATVLGHFGRGHGAVSPGAGSDADAFAQVLGDAVATGLEGSQIGQHLQQMAGLMERGYETGSTLSTLGLSQTMLGLSGAGIAPVQAGRIASGFTGAMMSQGMSGPQGAAGWALMRAAGYTGRGGPGEYARTMFALQNPSEQAGVLGKYIEQLRMSGMNPDDQALVMQRAFQQIGVTLGADQVRALASGGFKPGASGGLGADTLIGKGQLAMTAFGAITGEAGLEAQRVGIGGKIAPAMQDMLRSVNNIADAFSSKLGPAIEGMAAGIERFTAWIDEGAKTLPIPDVGAPG